MRLAGEFRDESGIASARGRKVAKHNMALNRLFQLDNRTHVFEILEVTTALFEFITRTADQKVFTDHVGIRVGLLGVGGRQFAWREEFNLEDGPVAQRDDHHVPPQSHTAKWRSIASR
jgi:hypothetical protein